MKRHTIIAIFSSILLGNVAHAQLKVTTEGNVGLGTNAPVTRLHVLGEGMIDSYTGTWGRAFWTRVHYRNAGAYNLWNAYYSRDVFFVNGEGWVWTGRGLYVDTDSTRIELVSPVQSPLLTVMQMEGKRYRYREATDQDAEQRFRFGLVAQELERVVPGAVRKMEDGTRSVAYGDVVAILIEAVKEQQQQIDSLQVALAGQEAEINRIKSRRWFRKRTTP